MNSVVKLNSNFHGNFIKINQNSRSFKNFISNSQKLFFEKSINKYEFSLENISLRAFIVF